MYVTYTFRNVAVYTRLQMTRDNKLSLDGLRTLLNETFTHLYFIV